MVSHDVLGDNMAGPGIRYYHLSRVLSHYTNLTLAVLPQNDQSLATLQSKLPDVVVIGYTRGEWDSLKEAAQWAEVIILSPFTAAENPRFLSQSAVLVLDGYNPLLPEWLTTLAPDNSNQQIGQWADRMVALFYQYLAADFVICASERQRHWWLGQLEVSGRINPLTFHEDRSLRNLVDVVPYGLPEVPPERKKPIVKGVWPGVHEEDVVLLWGGGLWPWLDPLTAVQAVKRLQKSRPQLKLIFPGTIHPNLDVARYMPVRNTEVFKYAQENGLLNTTVFFGEWVPYADWQSVLLESDIALSLHHDTIETQLAYRSRMLEYFWAGVPVIATCGDATSELVSRYNLGEVVGYEDVDAVVQAIAIILNDRSVYQAGFARARQDLTWEKAAEPLIRFCQNPRRAADRRGREVFGVRYYENRIRELETLVSAYQSGKFMRFMRSAHELRTRWKNWMRRS